MLLSGWAEHVQPRYRVSPVSLTMHFCLGRQICRGENRSRFLCCMRLATSDSPWHKDFAALLKSVHILPPLLFLHFSCSAAAVDGSARSAAIFEVVGWFCADMDVGGGLPKQFGISGPNGSAHDSVCVSQRAGLIEGTLTISKELLKLATHLGLQSV